MVLRVKSLGERLRLAREEANLTQAELAERLSVSTRTVQYWESGKDELRPKHRRAVAAFLDEFEAEAAA